MAENKKVYSLEINGIKESYDSVVKLNDVLESIDKTINEVNKSEVELNKTKKESKQQTDELTKIQEKLKQADSDYQKELIKAKQQLQEKNKALADEVKAEKLVEGSYYQKQNALTKLGKQIKSYVATTDEEQKTLDDLKIQYATLNDELKDFDKSLGNHQREVGNYQLAVVDLQSELSNMEKQLIQMLSAGEGGTEAFKQLSKEAGELKNNIESAKKEIDNFAKGSSKINDVVNVAQSATSAFGLYQSTMAVFGTENEAVAESMQKLMAAMTALQSLQQINQTLTNKSTASYKLLHKALQLLGIEKKKTTTATVAQTTAEGALTAATTAQTVATGAATVATKTFSKALIATGIGAIVVLLGTLIANFKEFKTWIGNLLPDLSGLQEALAGVGNAIQNWVLAPFKALGKVIQGDFKGAAEEVKKGVNVINSYEEGAAKKSLSIQETKRKLLATSRAKELDEKIKDTEAKLGSDYKYSEEGQEVYKEYYDNLLIQYKDDAEKYKEIQREKWAYDRELEDHKEAVKAANQAAIDKQTNEDKNNAKKAAEERKKQLEKLKSDTEKILSETTKLYADNEQKRLDIQKSSIQSLSVFNQEQLDYKVTQLKENYNQQSSIHEKELAKELELIKKQYDDLIKEAERLGQDTTQLTNDKNSRLQAIQEEFDTETLQRQKQLNEDIINEQTKFNNLLIQNSKDNVATISKTIDDQLKNLKGLATTPTKTGGMFDIIDVDATKEKLSNVKGLYQTLADSIKEESKKVEEEYNTQLQLTGIIYGQDSKQYQDLLNEKTKALAKYTSDYEATNVTINQITEQEGNLLKDYWQSVSTEISNTFKEINDAVLTPLFDAFNTLMEMQLEDAQKNLEKVQKLHDKAVQEVTDSQNRIQGLNDQIQNANALRRDELEKTLADEVLMLKQRESEEQRLAKETQKAEAEVAKKERQQAKMDAGKKIIESIINTMVGVTAALPNLVLAGIVGAMGAASTAVATAQYAKLEDGGLLSGKPHSQGGIKIPNTNIEVEGGEYVINKKATQMFLPILDQINGYGKSTSSNTITYNNVYRQYENGGQLNYDLVNSILAKNVPTVALNESLEDIQINPVVSVVDINKAQQRVTRVRDISGV